MKSMSRNIYVFIIFIKEWLLSNSLFSLLSGDNILRYYNIFVTLITFAGAIIS